MGQVTREKIRLEVHGFENHPLGKVRLGGTTKTARRWFEKSLETWGPRRGEDPGVGDSARLTER